LKSGITEKENTHISGTKPPSNMEKLIIQNALNYLSTFLLQVQCSEGTKNGGGQSSGK